MQGYRSHGWIGSATSTDESSFSNNFLQEKIKIFRSELDTLVFLVSLRLRGILGFVETRLPRREESMRTTGGDDGVHRPDG